MIKSMVTEYIDGQMEECIKVNGRTENSMAKENMLLERDFSS